jgi:hypothetical protein
VQRSELLFLTLFTNYFYNKQKEKGMSDDEVARLIQELKQLQVQERRVIAALEEAHRTRQTETTPTNRISTTNIIGLARATDPIQYFSIGDHVVIINKVRKPNNRLIDSGDRTEIVVGVHTDRIDIKTTNGTLTWRAPKNLRHHTSHGGRSDHSE